MGRCLGAVAPPTSGPNTAGLREYGTDHESTDWGVLCTEKVTSYNGP